MADSANEQGSQVNVLPGCKEFFQSLEELLQNGPLSKFDYRIYKAMNALPLSTSDYLLNQDLFEVIKSTGKFIVDESNIQLVRTELNPNANEFLPIAADLAPPLPEPPLNPNAEEYRPLSTPLSDMCDPTPSEANLLEEILQRCPLEEEEDEAVPSTSQDPTMDDTREVATQKDEDLNRAAIRSLCIKAEENMKKLKDMYVRLYMDHIDLTEDKSAATQTPQPPPSSTSNDADKKFLQKQLARLMEKLEKSELFNANLKERNSHLERRKQTLEGAVQIAIEKACQRYTASESPSNDEEKLMALKSSLRCYLDEDNLNEFARDFNNLISIAKEDKSTQTEERPPSYKILKRPSPSLQEEGIPSPMSIFTSNRLLPLSSISQEHLDPKDPPDILEKITSGVTAIRPQLSKGEILEYLFIIKTKNNNRLAGMKLDNIIQRILDLASSHS